MLIVKVTKKEGIERALKKLKRKFISTKTNKELRDRKAFKKKSVKKREQKMKAIYVEQKFNTEED